MAQTICNGDYSTWTIPQSFSDLSGGVSSGQLPGGAPTGSGSVVMATSPVLTTPNIGVAIATSINGLVVTPTTGTLTISAGKTYIISNSITVAGTDGTVMTFPSTSATIARTDASNTFTGHQTIEGVTSTGATGTGLLTFSISPTFTGTVGAAAITATGLITTSTLATTGLCTKYNNVTTTGQGLPALVGVVTTGTHTAAIAATSLLAAPVAGGFYRISAYMKVTIATSTPVAGPITITYKDSDGVAQSVVMMLQNAAGSVATSTGSTTTTPVFGAIEIYCGSGTAIQYAVAFSGTGTYELVLKCESF